MSELPPRTGDPTAESDRRRLALYGAVAAAWNSEGVAYGVVNGLHTGGEPTLGRDLDVLVCESDFSRAVDLTLSVMRDRGWLPVVKRRPWTTLITGITTRTEGAYAVEIDLFCRQRWFNVRLVDGPDEKVESTDRNGIRLDPWGSFAKRVLLQVLGAGAARLREQPDRLSLSPTEDDVAAPRLTELLGQRLARDLLDAVRRRDLDWIGAHAQVLRRAIALRAFVRAPLCTVRDTLVWARDEVFGIVAADRAAPIVALVGPDGVGKSSTIVELKRILDSRFRFEALVVRHWRPGLLPPLRFLHRRPAESPANSPPRRRAGRFGGVRLLYYSLDFILGHLLRDRREVTQLVPILYDRCMLDMAVDPLRYGLSSGRSVPLLWRFVPKPDLIILIDDEVGRIRARKPELPEEELVRQLSAWRGLVASGQVQAAIRAGDSAEETAQRLLPLFLRAFIALGDVAPERRSPGTAATVRDRRPR